MAALDVTGMAYVGFPVDTTVTAPDSNTFTALAGYWFGVPIASTSMTVSPAGDAMLMSRAEVAKQAANSFMGGAGQAMTVTHVRTSA